MKKVRLSFEVPERLKKEMDWLISETNSTSLTEVLRKSIDVLTLAVLTRNQGGKVVLRSNIGEEETLRLL